MPMTEDAELLRRYVTEKSEEAFAELVRRHLDLVYSTALRQLAGDTHLAQDVAQGVFTALARKAASLTDRTTLTGWLYLGAHHAAAQAVRGAQRRRTREQEAYLMHEKLSSSDAVTDWDRVRPVLDGALRELTDADREAVLLRYFERRPFADIGAALHVGDDAARMRVDRALEKLRALLARRGVTSTAAALSAALASEAMVAAPAGLATTITGAALVGTGSSAVTVATIFMNKSTIVAAIAALAASVFALREFNQRQMAEAAKHAADAELVILRGRLHAAEQRANAGVQRTATLQRELEASRATLPAPAPAKTGIVVTGAQGDPASDHTYAGTTLAEAFSVTYAPFFLQLGLAPEQRDQFVALLVKWKEHGNELFGAAITAGMKPGGQLAAQIRAQTDPEREANIRAQFGETTLQAFQQYEMMAPLRNATMDLASILFRGEAPLSPTQADQLVAAMAGNVRIAGGKIDLASINNEAVMTQAQGILSPTQLPELQRMLNQIRFMHRAKQAQTASGNN
jgi:RNA polymerase sigma factor (sigma-70 family)